MGGNIEINPAALAALLKGDLENASIALTPGGIEAQEAMGQNDFVASCTLPIRCSYCTREQLEQIGIIFGEVVDDLFVEVQLPKGWKKVATKHSMHSNLLDNKGRKRASIFYKAAFYDRRASISLDQRFRVRSEPVCGWGSDEYDRETTLLVVAVRDCGEIVWKSEEFDGHAMNQEVKDREMAMAKGWLGEYYPDWKNLLAYWD